MAQVQFYKITYAQLENLAIKDGQMIFTTDTGKLYLDKSNSERIQIDGIDFTYGLSLDGTSISIVKNGGSSSITLPVVTTTSAGLMSAADKTKLDGIAEGATRVLVDDAISASSTNPVQNSVIKAALDNKISTSLKGAINGVAELDAIGKVPSSQLPSYVDDVVEGYLYNSKFYKESTHTTEIAGETGKIYVDLTTEKTYRWSGTAFVEISASLALGETSSTAYRGDRGAAAYTHAVTNKGSAFTNGFYKITTNGEGHVTATTAVQKSDITNLGIPGENITYTIDNEDSEILLKGSDDSSQTILSAGTNITIDNNNEISAQTDEEVEEFINGDSTLVSEENTKLAIENTADSAPMKINLGGNTKQDSLTGINLLNTYNINATLNNLTLTSDEKGVITLNGTTTAGNVFLKQDLSFPLNGTYTLIFKKISGEMTTTGTVRMRYTIGNSSSTGGAAIEGRLISNVFDKDSSIIVTTATINDTLASLSMYINPDATFTNYKVAIYLVQGTYTSENIPNYQPYVGGTPSPNPDYPQNIEVVTGNNKIVIQNKNIFNNSNLRESKYIDYSSSAVGNTIVFGTSANSNSYYKCAYLEANKTYKISYEYDSTKSTGHRFGAITDENDVVLQICRTWNETPKNVTIQPTQSGYLSICVDKNSYNIQIEENTQVTSYVEHQEQNYEINLGKNLLQEEFRQGNTNDTTVTNRLFTVNSVKIKKGKTYTISTNLNTSSFLYYLRVANTPFPANASIYNGSSISNSSTTYTATSDGYLGIMISKVDTTSTIIVSDISDYHFQVEEGNQATSYSPYFSPIELCKIGDYKDEIRKSTGKNLFDKDNAIILNAIPYDNKISSTPNGKTTYINCLPNTTYTISKIAGNRFQVCTTNTIPELETSIDNHITNNNVSSITIITGNNAKYLCVYFYHITDTITQQEMLDSIQIEKGITKTDIEPYGVGIWYKYKQIEKVALDGSENWTAGYGTNLFDLQTYFDSKPFVVGYGLSNYYIYNSVQSGMSENVLNGQFALQKSSSHYNIFIKNSAIANANDFKAWLSTHNTTVYYPLANPTYEIITETQLINQLDYLDKNAKSYLSQTNITQENAEQSFTLKIEGYKDNAPGMYQSALDQIQYYSAGKNISIDKNNVISASTDDSVNSYLYGYGSRTMNDDSAFTIYDGFPTSPIEFKLKGNTYQNSSILPEEYTQVDYIQSSGTQYIELNQKLKNNQKIIGDIEFGELGNQSLFGINLNTYKEVVGISSSNKWEYLDDVLGWQSSDTIAQTNTKYNIEFYYGTSNQYLKVNNTNVISTTATHEDKTSTTNTLLFARSNGSSAYAFSKIKLYSCKLYDNNNLVLDLIPCYRNSDNVIGLYDLVNDVFYTNQGTGNFTYGNVVSIPNPDYPQNIYNVSGNNKIEIRGKNLFKNLPSSRTRNGLTMVNDGEKIKISGTVTENYPCFIFYADGSISSAIWWATSNSIHTENGFFTQDNKNYNLSVNIAGNSAYSIVLGKTTDVTTSFLRVTGNQTLNLDEKINFVSIGFDPNQVVDLEFKIQIEEGTVATTYEPYQEQNYEINLGKNLLENKLITTPITKNGVTVTPNKDGTFTINGTATANSYFDFNRDYYYEDYTIYDIGSTLKSQTINNYTLSASINNGSITLGHNKSNGWWSILAGNGKTYDNAVLSIQLEKGSIATSYAPYFTPIELCKIGNYKDEIRKSTGKNKIDKTNETIIQSKYGIDVSNLKIGETYTFSSNIPIDTFKISNRHDGYNSVYKHENNQLFSSFTFTMAKNENISESDTQYLFIKLNSSTWASNINDLANYTIQIEQGLQATNIEPYGKDIWYKYCEIGKIDLSTLTWSSAGANTTGYRRYYTNTIPNIKYVSSNTEVGKGFAEKYSIVKGQGISALINVFAIDVASISFMDLQANNKPTGLLYYALANPTYEIITDIDLIKQLNNLSKAKIDQYYTTVNQYNNSMPFILDITYYLNNVDGRYFGNLSKIKSTETTIDDYLSSNSINPVQNNVITDKFNTKIDSGDVSFTQTLTSGAAVGTLTIEGQSTTLYAPNPGAVATELATTNTLYLTGVTSTAATQGDQIYNTRTSTSSGVSYSPTAQAVYVNGTTLESQGNKTLSVSYPSGLDSNADNIYPSAGAVWRAEHLLRHIFGLDINTFSASSTYAVGDYVLYLDKLYKCTTAVTTAGTWNSSNWTETQIFTL